MKNHMFKKLICAALVLLSITSTVACGGQNTPADTSADTSATEVVTTVETEAETNAPVVAVKPDFFAQPDITYNCQDDSVLLTFNEKTVADFTSACDYYKALGYEVYSQSQKNGNSFITLVKDSQMAHLYFYTHKNELNMVTSETAGAALPDKNAQFVAGDTPVTFTQMKDNTHVNGMGYIIQLSDGSFIIYDGSYKTQVRSLIQTLKDMAGDKKIVVRAWILTHSHDDHYPSFSVFATKYSQEVSVEHVIFAPIDADTAKAFAGDDYFNTQFKEDVANWPEAKVIYAHTGMNFTFGDLNMEVLLAADDLFKEGNHNNYFNNSSLVSRLYTNDYSVLFLGDIGKEGCYAMMDAYGDYLQSNVCQISHHGVEDAPLAFYETVKASIWMYPCTQALYDLQERDNDVRDALRERAYTREILIAGLGQFTRTWGTTFEDGTPLSMPNYTPAK